MTGKSGYFLITLAFAIILVACHVSKTLPPTLDPGLVQTQVEQTLSIQLTLQAGETAVAQLTELAQATSTMEIPTALPPTPLPTPLPTATPTPVPVSHTPPPIPCDWALFLLDKTGNTGGLGPGQSFIKTWQIKNIGSCTWSPDYALVFVQGDRMSGPGIQKLGVTVSPGQVLETSLVLQAPGDPAQYAGYWLLRNEAGMLFGGGSDANQPFPVLVKVIQPATSVYEFLDHLCEAEWSSGSNRLDCPQSSSLNYSSGYFTRLANPELEDGSIDNEPALVMVPDQVNGFITGKFPPITIRAGDHFQTVTGCIFDNPECNVSMQISFTQGISLLQNLDTWPEIYDGNLKRVDIDLSPLAGKTVQFMLSVYNNGSAINDWVFWLRPRISR